MPPVFLTLLRPTSSCLAFRFSAVLAPVHRCSLLDVDDNLRLVSSLFCRGCVFSYYGISLGADEAWVPLGAAPFALAAAGSVPADPPGAPSLPKHQAVDGLFALKEEGLQPVSYTLPKVLSRIEADKLVAFKTAALQGSTTSTVEVLVFASLLEALHWLSNLAQRAEIRGHVGQCF